MLVLGMIGVVCYKDGAHVCLDKVSRGLTSSVSLRSDVCSKNDNAEVVSICRV